MQNEYYRGLSKLSLMVICKKKELLKNLNYINEKRTIVLDGDLSNDSEFQ